LGNVGKNAIGTLKKIIQDISDVEWACEEERRKEILTKKIKRSASK
jgi:hypothetical protein